MKLLGIMFVFVSVFSIGLVFSKRQLSVLKGIERAEKHLGNILLDIKNEHLTTAEIFNKICTEEDFETKEFFSLISPEKLNDTSKIAYQCGFIKNKTAADIFGEAFSVLGKYSVEDQEKEIEFCRNKLNFLYKKSEDEIKTRAKLIAYSGFFGGILAAILLI